MKMYYAEFYCDVCEMVKENYGVYCDACSTMYCELCFKSYDDHCFNVNKEEDECVENCVVCNYKVVTKQSMLDYMLKKYNITDYEIKREMRDKRYNITKQELIDNYIEPKI